MVLGTCVCEAEEGEAYAEHAASYEWGLLGPFLPSPPRRSSLFITRPALVVLCSLVVMCEAVGLSIRARGGSWGVVSQSRLQSRLVATSHSGGGGGDGGGRVPWPTLNHHKRRTGRIWDDSVTNHHTSINSVRY